LVADLSLDRKALPWVIEKNGWSFPAKGAVMLVSIFLHGYNRRLHKTILAKQN